MSLKGQVEDLGVAELLYMVGISRRSGLLRLDGHRGEVEILFRTGSIVAARDRGAANSLRELLTGAGVADDTHLAVLERQATRQGVPLAELLDEENVLPAGALDGHLQREIERVVNAALKVTEGVFAFELVEDEAETVADRFGGLLLADGLQPAKLPAIADRTRGGGLKGLGAGLSLPKTEGGRRVELLLDDSDISLPTLPSSELKPRRDAGQRPSTDGSSPRALLSLAWPALGRLLQQALEDDGVQVIRPRTGPEAVDWVQRSSDRGAPVTVIGDVTLTALPGLELLARVKLARRSARTVLLLDRRGTPAQRAAHRERAEALGVTHVVLHPAGENDAEARAAAEELRALVLAPPPRDETAAPTPVAALAPGAEPVPELFASAEANASAFARLAAGAQAARLATLLRELAPIRRSTRLIESLLDVAVEYAPRALLLTSSSRGVRAYGFATSDGAAHGGLREALRRLRIPPGDAELPCSALRDGRSRRVPAALAGASLLAVFAGSRPREVAAIPLSSANAPVAVLLLDDAGRPDELPPLGPLERFAAGLAPSLADALQRDERRAAFRSARAAAR